MRPARPARSALESRLRALETQQQAQLASLRQEKERLGSLLSRQNGALAGLARSLRAARSNSSLLQRQQDRLLESMKRLLRTAARGPREQGTPGVGRGWGGGTGPTYPPCSFLGLRLEATKGKASPLSHHLGNRNNSSKS